MKEFERRVFSQNGEDGIIEHIFNGIGTTDKVAVEFGVSAGGGGQQSNSRFLAENGWKTFWFDTRDLSYSPPNCTFKKVLLTPANICSVFEEMGVPTEFDLLSVDVDGNDYHLRQALSGYKPRVCVMEYNGCFPAEQEYIMPHNDDYRWGGWRKDFGASLTSLTIQANSLGYDLVYCDSQGVNAFYVRRDVNVFPAKEPKDVWVQLWWASKR